MKRLFAFILLLCMTACATVATQDQQATAPKNPRFVESTFPPDAIVLPPWED
jgi:hypothetical protein